MKQKEGVLREVQLRSAFIRLIEKDVVEVHTTSEYETMCEDIDEINSVILNMVGVNNHYVVVFVGQGSTASKATREYAAKESFRKNIIAEAIIINNLATRILANMYMKFSRPKQKIKVVGSKEEAMIWINELKEMKWFSVFSLQFSVCSLQSSVSIMNSTVDCQLSSIFLVAIWVFVFPSWLLPQYSFPISS